MQLLNLSAKNRVFTAKEYIKKLRGYIEKLSQNTAQRDKGMKRMKRHVHETVVTRFL